MGSEMCIRDSIGCFLVIISAQLLGCTTSPPRQGATPVEDVTPDPLEPVNRVIFSFNDKVDRYALKPVARTYRNVTPQGIRTGVTNFLGNISDVGVAANSLLQGKLEPGVRDFARVAVNTVFGIGGILDVATPMKLERHNEDFGQTLGVWGCRKALISCCRFSGLEPCEALLDCLAIASCNHLTRPESPALCATSLLF